MRESLFSPSWYRVAGLKPRIRSHVDIHRHTYRGELWYVLQDHAAGKFQRFTPAAHYLIGLMDGGRTVEEIWQAGRSKLADDAPSQEEMIRLLSQLHAADVLQSDVPPDTIELLQRFDKKQNVKWKQNVRNPLAMRFSIFDPEKFLKASQWIAKPLFGWVGAIIWLVAIAIGLVLLGIHWPELTKDVSDRILAPQNLVLLWFIYPFLKAFHEFGHAFAVKILGGEVHEMGIMFLVLTPVPYVDASASLAFRSKWQRMLVGAVGVGVELFMAACALMVWVSVEPGSVRSVAYNVILIAGISSILFNGNPLLRYDGYYVLADLLEIPNLATRGSQYVLYLIQRYPFGVKQAEPPLSTKGERVWFVIYTILSFCYRILIYIGIVQFIAGKFLTLGLLLAMWAVIAMIGLPLYKGLKFLFTSPMLRQKRKRAVAITAAVFAAAALVVIAVPFPLATVSEGVLWFGDESFVRSRTEGFVEKLEAPPGSSVIKGEVLVTCSDPLLKSRIKVLSAQLRELEVQYNVKELTDRVQAQVILDDLKQVRHQIVDARSRADELTIYSPAAGTFFVPTAQDLPGKFLKRGEIIGYVLNDTAISARVVVSQSDVDLVRNKTIAVAIRLPEKIASTLPSSLVREVPAGTDRLPAAVLGQVGGGSVPIDPRDEKGLKAFQKIFLFDIALPQQVSLFNVGGRVYVRFNHGLEPLAFRWYRNVRQLLLKRFNV
jgi:putative peptide zinc metalloprotease protein